MRKLILPILAMLASSPALAEGEAPSTTTAQETTKKEKAPKKGDAQKEGNAQAPKKDEKGAAKDEPVCPAGTTEQGNRCVETPTDGRN